MRASLTGEPASPPESSLGPRPERLPLGLERWIHRDAWHGRAALLGLSLLPLVALGLLDTPLCLTAALFHLPCPGCGLTRATLLLLHGQWRAAMALHPLAPLVSPLVIGGLGYVAVRYVVTGKTTVSRAFVWVAAGLSVALFLLWVARWLGAFGGPVPV